MARLQPFYLPRLCSGGTLVLCYSLSPSIQRKPGAQQELPEALVPSLPYESGQCNPTFTFSLYPVYLRGEAYLSVKQIGTAASEFQIIIDYAGVVGNEPIGALARLGLARAYALSGDTTKAKTSYQDFFAIWRSGDAEAPLLTYVQLK